MWKKFTTCIFVLVMALTLTGCNEDPFPGRRSDEAKTDASGGGQQHGGHDAGSTGGVDIQKACVPQCGGKVCGDNGCDKSCGTCSDNETCSAGQCVATGGGNNTGTHPCEGCKQGILCYQVSGLSLKCQAFDTGLCTADGKCAPSGLVFDDSCSDNNSATADSVASYSTYVAKDKLCIHTPIGGGGGTGCTVTGCPAGQGCNSATGACQVAGGTQGDLNCAIQRTDSTTWDHLNGGGVAGVSLAGADSWSNLGSPNSAGIVNFKLMAGQGAASILPEISLGKQWAYGALAGVDSIVGEWKITCDGNPSYTFKQGTTPVCSTTTPANTGCLWKGGQGVYRMVFRAR